MGPVVPGVNMLMTELEIETKLSEKLILFADNVYKNVQAERRGIPKKCQTVKRMYLYLFVLNEPINRDYLTEQQVIQMLNYG